MKKLLNNKVALILGASRGIGKATARLMGKEGAKIIAVARSNPDLIHLQQELQTDYGTDCLIVCADVATQAGIAEIEATQKKNTAFKTIDFLINNVGVGKYGKLADISVEDYDIMMNTNMRSNFLATKAFTSGMVAQKKGHIVFVGSVAGLRGAAGESVYCATKFAQMGFAQAIDHEFRKQGVKVSIIAPGAVNTQFAFRAGRSPEGPLIDRMLDSDAVADAILFALTQSEKTRVFLVELQSIKQPRY